MRHDYPYGGGLNRAAWLPAKRRLRQQKRRILIDEVERLRANKESLVCVYLGSKHIELEVLKVFETKASRLTAEPVPKD